MRKVNKEIKLASFEEIFGTEEEIIYKVRSIALSDLLPYHRHPFRVLDDEKMAETVESIKKFGVLVPGIARPVKEGKYELVAGHRRHRGCTLAGLTEMPIHVRELNDDEADIVMVDFNIQREDLLISEKAFAYKIKFDAMKHQGKQSGSETISTTEQIGEESGESGRTIQRYIRLSKLNKELLDLVDSFRIKPISAEKLSFLTYEEQDRLLQYIRKRNKYPSGKQAEQLKRSSAQKKLTEEDIAEIMAESNLPSEKVVIPSSRIRQYFPDSFSRKEMEQVIYMLLDGWCNSNGEDT